MCIRDREHGIAVKESRGRLSYCPPGRTKFITAKKLSKKLEKEQVLIALSQNIQLAVTIQPASEQKPDKIRKLVDIQAKVAAGKGIGYERWAKKFNLKRWSQTLCLLQEKKLLSEDALCSLEEPQPKFFSATIMSPFFTFLIKSLSISSMQ